MFTVKQVVSALPWRRRMSVPTYILHYMIIKFLVLSTLRTFYHMCSLWKDNQPIHRHNNVFILGLCLKIMLCSSSKTKIFWQLSKVKGEKVKVFCALHKGIWGSLLIGAFILNFGTRWKWVVSLTPWLLLYALVNEPGYPLNRRLGGLQSRPGCCGEKKNLLALPGLKL